MLPQKRKSKNSTQPQIKRTARNKVKDYSKLVNDLINAANRVISAWEGGDLAMAVNDLQAVADEAREFISKKGK